MSWKVLAKVYERRIGSQVKKAVMTYCADKASDDGRGIWASKGTIAAELEANRATIFRAFSDLVAAGLLVPEGKRACANGSTIEYRIDLAVLDTFPPVDRPKERPVAQRNQSHTATGRTHDQSHSATPPVAQCDPDQSHSATQTSLRTSLEPAGAAARATRDDDRPDTEGWSDDRLLDEVMAAAGIRGPSIPTYWMPPAATIHVGRWRRDLNLDPASIVSATRASRSRHPDPPSGPKALDSVMRRLSAEIAAPAMSPTPANVHPLPTGGRNVRSEQRHREDQAIDETIRRIASGELQRGPDPSDPFAGG